MGSISGLNWNSITLIAIVSVICLPLLYSKAWDLNLMTVGDEGAKSMGVNAGHIRIFVMIISSLLVAALVAFVRCHRVHRARCASRRASYPGKRSPLRHPGSRGLGAILFLFADVIAMNLFRPSTIPTGTVMSAIGVPFFLYLILRGRRKEYWS